MSANKNAALPGRQGGDQERAKERIDPEHHIATWETSFDPAISNWLGRVDLAAGTGNAARSERLLSQAIAVLLLEGKDCVVASIPEFGAKAGLGPDAVSAALRRLKAKGMLFYDSQPGRGLRTVVSPRLKERRK